MKLFQDRITSEPDKLNGQACIRGMRLPVATIMRCFASGMSRSEIIEAYPELEDDDITAALQYAADLTDEKILPIAQG